MTSASPALLLESFAILQHIRFALMEHPECKYDPRTCHKTLLFQSAEVSLASKAHFPFHQLFWPFVALLNNSALGDFL
jgi:hypothetical protein